MTAGGLGGADSHVSCYVVKYEVGAVGEISQHPLETIGSSRVREEISFAHPFVPRGSP